MNKYNSGSPRSVISNYNNIFYLTNGTNNSNNFPQYFSNYSLRSSKNTKRKLEFGKIYKVKEQHSGQTKNTDLLNTSFPIFHTDDSIQNKTIFRLKFTISGPMNYSNIAAAPSTPIEYVVYFKTRNSAERFHRYMLKTQNNYLYPNQGRIRKIQLNTKIYNHINEYYGNYNNSPFQNFGNAMNYMR